MSISREGKLRNKILRMMFVVGFGPIVILGVLSFYGIRIFHSSDLASIEKNLIDQKTGEINAFIESIISTFEVRVSFEQVSEIELAGQHFILKQLLDQFSDIQEVSFLSLSGFETSRSNRLSPDGVSSAELQNQANTEKFVKAKSGHNYISPVYLTPEGPTITVASPVFNRNGILISAISGEVSLKNLQKIVERTQLGNTGYLYVVAQDGFLIAHSQKYKLASEVSNIDFVKKVVSKEADDMSRYDSAWNEPVVGYGKYLEELKMGVIAEWPVAEADLIVHTLNRIFLAVSILVFAATLFFSFLMAGRIVKPIKILETGTRSIAEGRFDQPILIKTGDEIEDLSVAFNNMMSGLKKLEELEKEFVFIAAHDLRTPVTAIKGYLSLVLDGSYGPVEPKVKEALEKVTKANQRLIQLVNDLLRVAKAEAGRIPIKVTVISPVSPIKEIMEEIKPLADEKQISLVYQPSQDIPSILADPERIKEIMVNLVGNSIKYTSGKGTINITHEVKDGELVTNIKDEGMGISLENQKKLFEKYFRVESDKMDGIQGTGLGLFIVKEIVEKMNGKIWVRSEEGKGSTFSFSLPLAK